MSDHCVLDFAQQPQVLRCLECGHTEPVQLPMPLKELNARGQRFNNAHRGCRKPAGEGKA